MTTVAGRPTEEELRAQLVALTNAGLTEEEARVIATRRRRGLAAPSPQGARAEALVVIADASKFEARGSMVVCPLQRVHTLITGASAPADVLDHIRSAGVTVVTIGDDAVPPEEALAAVEM